MTRVELTSRFRAVGLTLAIAFIFFTSAASAPMPQAAAPAPAATEEQQAFWVRLYENRVQADRGLPVRS